MSCDWKVTAHAEWQWTGTEWKWCVCENFSDTLHYRWFTMTMTTNPAYTHFCFVCNSICVRERLPAPLLYKDLISASVEYVNPSEPPPHPTTTATYPRSFSLPTRPPLPHSLYPSRWKKEALEYFSWRLVSFDFIPRLIMCGGEKREKDIILLTILVPYGERTGLSSGTVGGVGKPACLSNQGVFSFCSSTFCLSVCHSDSDFYLVFLQKSPSLSSLSYGCQGLKTSTLVSTYAERSSYCYKNNNIEACLLCFFVSFTSNRVSQH